MANPGTLHTIALCLVPAATGEARRDCLHTWRIPAMRFTTHSLLPLLVLAAGFALISGRSPAADAEDGFTPLFNGKDMTGLKTVGVKEDTFKVVNGEIRCSGKPNGYFYTEKPYKNYLLKFDLKYARPAD